jgi:putative membrane protein
MKNKPHQAILIIVLAVFVWSGINPKDQFTWLLEVAPAIVGFGFIWYYYKRFKFTTLVYSLIATQAIILMVGGHYTYAEVPLFNWLKDLGLFARNNYDKVGHFAQGFVPAMVAREILLRNNVVKKGAWLSFLLVCIAGAISAVYEIVEWWTSLMSGEAGDAFLGTQGYIWDTQSDMLLAFIGAIAAVILLSKIHNKALEKLNK